jgi:hypothetical protein
MDWNTIAILAVFGVFNAISFWMGSRLFRGESVIPTLPGKLEVIEPEEPQDRYGEIWPKDSVIHDEGEI